MKAISFPSRLVVLLSLASIALALPRTSPARTVPSPTAFVERCSWDQPGANQYSGDVISAVDHYSDLAPSLRERLKSRMARRDYDDVVTIGRTGITGRARYGNTIRDMHFGDGRVCREVGRSGWAPAMQERGLVYCEGSQCILVPTICRNVSRISRADVADERLVAAASADIGLAPEPMLPPAPADVVSAPEGDGSFVAATEPVGGGGAPGTFVYPGVVVGGGPSGPIVTWPANPVPEPDTWGLMIASLVAAGAWRYWRDHGPTEA